jgi:trimeric autotransporter adhesin
MTVGRIPSVEGGIQPTLLTTKGDIIVATGNATLVRQGVGANGTVLTANSAQADGVEWVTPVSGGMTLLSTTSMSGSSVTISSIDQTYKNLVVEIQNVTATGNYSYRWRPNGLDDSSNINAIRNIGASTSTFGNMGGSNWMIDNNTTTFLSNSTNNKVTITIFDYASTDSYKNYTLTGSGVRSSGSDALTSSEGGTILFNTAISSIGFLTGATLNGGTVRIYGVK